MSGRRKITRHQASKLILGAAGAFLTRDTLAQSEQVPADRRFAPLQKEIADRCARPSHLAREATSVRLIYHGRPTLPASVSRQRRGHSSYP
jgi:hypothetical protein